MDIDIDTIIERAGGPTKLGRAVGRRHSTVLKWRVVPPQHVRTVSRLIGVPCHLIRSDLYDDPADAAPITTVGNNSHFSTVAPVL